MMPRCTTVRQRHMGITAENIAAKYGITAKSRTPSGREPSPRRGSFSPGLQGPDRRGRSETKKARAFDTDEHIRSERARGHEGPEAGVKTDGTVTAGNASGLNDAAAALVLMERAPRRSRA